MPALQAPRKLIIVMETGHRTLVMSESHDDDHENGACGPRLRLVRPVISAFREVVRTSGGYDRPTF